MMAEYDAATEAGEEGISPLPADADLQLKKRARRRLVGAAALVLFAIIVLPLVMDRAPRPPLQDIQVRIPSQDAGGLVGRLLPGKPLATPLPAASAKTPAEAEAPGKASGVAEHSSVPPAASVAAKAPSTPSPAPTTAASPAPQPAEKPAAGETSKEAAKAVKPAPAAAAEPVRETAVQWVVQLGAFKETGNVKHLQAKLKEIHLPSYAEQVDTAQGQRIRVRAGPFATREAAEKARARLKLIGVDGPVVQK